MTHRSVNEALGDQLEQLAVRTVFGVVGEDTAKLALDIQRRGIEFFSARHEAIAVGMADGYAHMTGRLGVALLSRGPGLTNGLTQTVTAAKGRAPIVIIAGDTAVGIGGPRRADASRRHGKHILQGDVFAACGVRSTTLRSPDTAAADFLTACSVAQHGETIVVNVPIDVLEAAAGNGASTADLAPRPDPQTKVPQPEQIDVVADLLRRARRPVVLAGRGALHAREELERLADASGALLATTLRAQNLFADHPWAIGTSGFAAPPTTAELLAGADVVLAFGASLNIFTTAGDRMFPQARLVWVDAGENPLPPGAERALVVAGDALLSAHALAAELHRRDHRSNGYRTAGVAARIERGSARPEHPDRGARGNLDPRLVVETIRQMLPEDLTVVVDNGHATGWPFSHAPVRRPIDLVWPGHGSQVGAGVGVALGVAAANRNDRLTALFLGDGAFMMMLSDIDTAVRYRWPVVVVILNDRAFGAEIRFLEYAGLPSDMVRYTTPDFAQLARDVGGRGLTVDELSDFVALPAALEGLDGPLVIDCRVDPDLEDSWVPVFYGRRAEPGAVGA